MTFDKTPGRPDLDLLNQNIKLRTLLQQIAVSAFNGRSDQVNEWLKMDRSLKAYKDRRLSDHTNPNGTGDRDVRGGRLDETQQGENYLDDLNVPVIFLLLDTLEAQFNKQFFTRDTVWTYTGRTGEAEEGAHLLTNIIRAGMDSFQNVEELLRFVRNGLKYGVGITSLNWDTVQEPVYSVHNGAKVKINKKRLSGVSLTNLSPYRMIRDQAVPWDRIDNMRFLGSWRPIAKYDILRRYGVEITEAESYNWLFTPLDNSISWGELFGLGVLDNAMTLEADLYIDLVPADYGIGESTVPQVWHIVLAGWDRILLCEPANLPVGKYPYRTWVPDGDGFDLRPLNRLDIVKDMQALFNWLFNSHLWAIRVGLDGNLVVDPAIIDMQTIEQRNKNRRGNTFLVNEEFWGIPGMVQQGIYQLPTNNSTAGHMEFGSQVIELMKLVVGTTDPIIGEDSPSSRRTAEEIASTTQAAGARMLLLFNRFHHSFLRPLGYDVAKYTQDLLDHTCFVELAPADKQSYETEVAWQDLLVDFKTIVGDNFISTDPQAKINSWNTTIQTIFQNPQLMASFNLASILLKWMKEMGITDAEQYLSTVGLATTKANAIAQVQPQGGTIGQPTTQQGQSGGPGLPSLAAPPPSTPVPQPAALP
jgi:hypothetical protein